MFEREITGEEILLEMDKHLRKNAFDKKAKKIESRIETVSLLNEAASNFDDIGLLKEAEALTRLAEYVSTERTEDQIIEDIKSEEEMIDIDEGFESSEEDQLYDELMEDPEVAGEVAIEMSEDDDEDMDVVPDLTQLFSGEY